jgi:cytochrome c oxidase subunit 2
LSPTPGPGRSGSRRTGLRLAVAAVATALLTAGCDLEHAYERSLNLGLPEPITDQAQNIYDLWLGSVAAALAVGVFVWGLIVYAVMRYRKNSDELPRQVRYNLPIEVLYTVVPFVIIAVLFYYTAVSENFVNNSKKNPDLRVNIVGFQWNWQFNYPEQGVQVTGSPRQPATMVLPVGQRIRFVETSPDVIHAWFVPEFLFKRDVVPGRSNSFEVTIRKEGTFLGRCAEFCGEKHSRMNFYVKVVSAQAFESYITALKADPAAAITETGGEAIPTQPEYGKVPGQSGDSEGEGSHK